MNLSDQIQSLIKSGAWIQIYVNGQPQPNLALGAAAWIQGRGLLFAEIGAEHQGHVHRIDAACLEMDGETMVDAYDSVGSLAATIHGMSPEEIAANRPHDWLTRIRGETATGRAWRRFWSESIKTEGRT